MKRKEQFILQEIGGESILVPLGQQVIDTNGMVLLNATARHVWELLASEQSLEALAADLVKNFDVELDRARVDVGVFLDEITRIGLLEL